MTWWFTLDWYVHGNTLRECTCHFQVTRLRFYCRKTYFIPMDERRSMSHKIGLTRCFRSNYLCITHFQRSNESNSKRFVVHGRLANAVWVVVNVQRSVFIISLSVSLVQDSMRLWCHACFTCTGLDEIMMPRLGEGMGLYWSSCLKAVDTIGNYSK